VGHGDRRGKDTAIDWSTLQLACRPIRQAFVATLQRVVELGYQRGEGTPWAKTVRTCHELLPVADGLWTILEMEGIEPTNNAAERALRQSVIQRKIRDLPSNSLRSNRPAAPSAAAGCSRSPPPSCNRGGMSGSSWSRPGSPTTAAG
jgi:hypothetical protein